MKVPEIKDLEALRDFLVQKLVEINEELAKGRLTDKHRASLYGTQATIAGILRQVLKDLGAREAQESLDALLQKAPLLVRKTVDEVWKRSVPRAHLATALHQPVEIGRPIRWRWRSC